MAKRRGKRSGATESGATAGGIVAKRRDCGRRLAGGIGAWLVRMSLVPSAVSPARSASEEGASRWLATFLWRRVHAAQAEAGARSSGLGTGQGGVRSDSDQAGGGLRAWAAPGFQLQAARTGPQGEARAGGGGEPDGLTARRIYEVGVVHYARLPGEHLPTQAESGCQTGQ